MATINYKDLFNVQGKTVLVTGGGRGIGLMITEAFVQNGCKVYISSRKGDKIRQVAENLTKAGPGSCHYIVADLSKPEGIESLVKQLSEKESKLHVLVNNSGATWGESFDDFSIKAYDRVLDLNVKSVFFLIQKCLPLLKAAGTKEDPARVLNIGSVAGILSMSPITTPYEISKAALHHLSKALGGSLAPQNINVNAIAFGLFHTDMSRGSVDAAGDSIINGIPIGRAARPEEGAGVCLFLSSKAGAYITGATISVDGGSTTGRSML